MLSHEPLNRQVPPCPDFAMTGTVDQRSAVLPVLEISSIGEFELRPPRGHHERLATLRQLISHDIPCILWGADALTYAHKIPSSLNEQRILVPDELLDQASAVLQEGCYIPASWDPQCLDLDYSPNAGKPFYLRGIRLKHRDIPEDEPYLLEPLPAHILLLPQSYFGLDVQSKERFQSIVPPFDVSNVNILAPKYHTFLEGLIECLFNPPITPHAIGEVSIITDIGNLIESRVEYPDDDLPRPAEILPEEKQILEELQTEEARWYLGMWFHERRGVGHKDIKDYKRRKTSAMYVPYLYLVGFSPNTF
ncbi:hypothetical protein NP233_g3213 [Leucocoprinus birnbaumii]|uniref:Uncharacterized protein n=1 Tax=Leucocoprinus birnbaumii TaxID=56174 RepID=A0AAD5W3E6_9AGAR|nr:hypothetical protein NP233_g3213 [Leucocoprinus birnbaumii]